MKARVKTTGEIVEVTRIVDKYIMTYHPHTITFEKDELDFDIEDYTPDYWTRLEHTYAGMAMQGMLANPAFWKMDWRNKDASYVDLITMRARSHAHALVEKLKEERK